MNTLFKIALLALILFNLPYVIDSIISIALSISAVIAFALAGILLKKIFG